MRTAQATKRSVSRTQVPAGERPRLFDPQSRLQSKDGICAYLGHISPATYDVWQAKGLVPGPIPGTSRYDVRQHDHLLDRITGIAATASRAAGSPYEQWSATNAG